VTARAPTSLPAPGRILQTPAFVGHVPRTVYNHAAAAVERYTQRGSQGRGAYTRALNHVGRKERIGT